jgi:hypothetical protein
MFAQRRIVCLQGAYTVLIISGEPSAIHKEVDFSRPDEANESRDLE